MTMASPNQNNQSSTGQRRRASEAGDRIGGRIDSAPLVALAAGVVVGAAAGALLPRTNRETEILGPVGSRLGQAAAEAARAAREAGKQELGLLSDARSPMEAIVDKAVGAVSAAGDAAASSVKGKQKA
jgi:hypothetical protein